MYTRLSAERGNDCKALGGGVYLPIIKSLAKNAGSEPGPTANKLGAFLIQTQLQSSVRPGVWSFHLTRCHHQI